MFPFGRLSLAQRVAVVVALGAALRLISDLFPGGSTPTGWTGYEPLAGLAQFQLGPALIQLALVVLWAVASILILRGGRSTQGPAAQPTQPSP